MHKAAVERLRRRFGPLLPENLRIEVPDFRFDLMYQLFQDVENFMTRSTEYQVVIKKAREQKDGSVWIGWDLETKIPYEGSRIEWIVDRLREIFAQYEWNSRYENIDQVRRECV